MSSYDVDWAEAGPRLLEAARTDSDWYTAWARQLTGADDQRAVDVGCGGAGMAIALAAAMPRTAQVVAVDSSEEVLSQAYHNVREHPGLVERINLRRGDLTNLRGLVGPGTVDLVWAAAAVHHAGDQQAAVEGLVALLRPGGRLALCEGGLPMRRLPWDVGVGAPGLENRLFAANDVWFARMRASLPGSTSMPYGWGDALRRAGLVDVTTRTTLTERPAPLTPDDRQRVVAGLAAWVDKLRKVDLLDPEDLTAWDQLLEPGGRYWLGYRDDVFWLEARSVHVGVLPG